MVFYLSLITTFVPTGTVSASHFESGTLNLIHPCDPELLPSFAASFLLIEPSDLVGTE